MTQSVRRWRWILIPQTVALLAATIAIGQTPETPSLRTAASIVARIDDQVVLLEDVLSAAVRRQLEKARTQMPEDKYRELEWNTLKQLTEAHVRRMVILKTLQTKLPKPEAMQMIRKEVAKEFEPHIQRMMRDSGIATREEFVAQLEKEGATLEDLRKEFLDSVIAQQFLSQLIKNQLSDPSREEMMRYYEDNVEAFAEKEGVVWHQIRVRFGGDKPAAKTKITAAAERLAKGEPFATVARECSDGSTAAAGGSWTLTSKGSYADTAVDEAIFSLPVGSLSPVIEGVDAYHIVFVEKRSDGSPKPFSEVQKQIRQQLTNERNGALRKAKLDELVKQHHIETVFDDDRNAPTASAIPPKVR